MGTKFASFLDDIIRRSFQADFLQKQSQKRESQPKPLESASVKQVISIKDSTDTPKSVSYFYPYLELDNIERLHKKLYEKRDDHIFLANNSQQSTFRSLPVIFQIPRRMAFTSPSSCILKSMCPIRRFSRQGQNFDTKTAENGISCYPVKSLLQIFYGPSCRPEWNIRFKDK